MEKRKQRPAMGRLLSWGLALVAGLSATAQAGDWPQILGQNRNGKADGEELPARLEPAGLKPLWTSKLGGGYAGPAVVGQRVIIFHRVGENEVVDALDANNGKRLWRAPSPASYRGGVDPNGDVGPRCVPLVAQNSVYAHGAAGDLVCVALDSGKIRWRRELAADYDAPEGYFGAGSSPILAGGKLLVNVGGKNAGIVALDPLSGKTIWQATGEIASYASPTLAKLGGKEQAIFVTRLNCVAVDPESGKAITLFPFGRTGPTVNAAMPLVVGDKLFVTASYNIGAELRQLSGASAKQVWASDDTLSSQYNTAVEDRGYLYGIHGREDAGVAELRCVELATGNVKWTKEGFGCAHSILAKDKILLLGVRGKLTLIAANPSKYEELGSGELGRHDFRALPALSGGKLYVRTSDSNSGELLCIPLGK
jgi:outer membrane protein assembly factor BamB